MNEAIAVGSGPPTIATSSNLSSCSFWFAASIRPTRPKNGSEATSDSATRPSRPKQAERPLEPDVAEGRDIGGIADPDELAHVERAHPGGIARRLVAEDPGAAGVDDHAVRGQRTAPGDLRIDGVAGRGQEDRVGLRLELAPVLVARRAPLELERLGVVALEREDAPGQVRERRQVAVLLDLERRGQRREAHRFDRIRARRPGDRGA